MSRRFCRLRVDRQETRRQRQGGGTDGPCRHPSLKASSVPAEEDTTNFQTGSPGEGFPAAGGGGGGGLHVGLHMGKSYVATRELDPWTHGCSTELKSGSRARQPQPL